MQPHWRFVSLLDPQTRVSMKRPQFTVALHSLSQPSPPATQFTTILHASLHSRVWTVGWNTRIDLIGPRTKRFRRWSSKSAMIRYSFSGKTIRQRVQESQHLLRQVFVTRYSVFIDDRANSSQVKRNVLPSLGNQDHILS